MQQLMNSVQVQRIQTMNYRNELINRGYFNESFRPPPFHQFPSLFNPPSNHFSYMDMLTGSERTLPESVWTEFNLTKPTGAENAAADSHVQPEAAPVVERELQDPGFKAINEGMKFMLVEDFGRNPSGNSTDNPIYLP
jgi:hypothetical protein